MKYLIVIAFALFAAVNAKQYDRPCRAAEMSPNVKTGFQVLPFMGTWFEVRRYEAANQTDLDCVTAFYNLLPGPVVQLINTGYLIGGQQFSFEGRAVLAPEALVEPNPAKLLVTFFEGQAPSIYWVMSTDYSRYAVVWSCQELPGGRSNEAAWVLSRTLEVAPEVETQYRAVLARNNLDLEFMRETGRDFDVCRAGTA